MADYTLRSDKGSKLTTNEADNNFIASRVTARFNCGSVITPSTGVWMNQTFDGARMSNIAAQQDEITLSPFCLGYDLAIDRVGAWLVSTTHDIRFLVYASNDSGQPSTKLYESATISAATGSNEVSASLSFTANTLYWVGMHSGGTGTWRGVDRDSLLPLGLGTGLNTSQMPNHISLGSTSIGSAPDTWSFATSQLAGGVNIPSVAFRAA